MDTLLIALLGWLTGILINRLADNLPAHRPILGTPHCPYCDTPRPVIDQSGVLSFLFLRGRCAACRAPIGLRAPLVEIASALLFAFLWTQYGPTVQWALMAIYTSVLVIVFVTDLEHRLIFNWVILPAILFAALASPWSPTGMPRSLLGGAIAFVFVLFIYLFGIVFERLRGLRVRGGAFGQGDVTLSTFIGLVTGFPFVIKAIIYGMLFGGLAAIGILVYHWIVHRRLALGAVFAYGPYLCVAAWIEMIFRF